MDFITQEFFETGQPLPEDWLNHQSLAGSILESISQLPAGSVVALQGTWGSGKTDVLARVAHRTYESQYEPGSLFPKAFWINPWQYGTPDLLSPLVLALMKRMLIGEKRHTTPRALRQAAEALIRAGIGFGMKAVSSLVPGATLLGLGAKEADELLEGLFKSIDKQTTDPRPDPDPAAVMSQRFRQLIDEYITTQGHRPSDDQQCLVCLDDVDRLEPDRQVAMLEAIRFLTSSITRVVFLIAMDPALAQAAVLTHYRDARFDPGRYLDKIFDVRFTLAGRSPDQIQDLIARHLAQKTSSGDSTLGEILCSKFGVALRDLQNFAPNALSTPELRNPRLIGRIAQRLRVMATSKHADTQVAATPLQAELLLIWLAIAERWPSVRLAFQDAGNDVNGRLDDLHGHIVGERNSVTAAVQHLPTKSSDPALGQIFNRLSELLRTARHGEAAKALLDIDHAMQQFVL